MTPHDRVRMKRAEECDRNSLESLSDAITGLQSTDDPELVPLHDSLVRRYNTLKKREDKKFRREDFEVQDLVTQFPGWGWVRHFKIRRYDGEDGISWDDLQALKNEAAGDDAMVIEIYPPAGRVVNEANIRHLWVVPEDALMPIDLYRETR